MKYVVHRHLEHVLLGCVLSDRDTGTGFSVRHSVARQRVSIRRGIESSHAVGKTTEGLHCCCTSIDMYICSESVWLFLPHCHSLCVVFDWRSSTTVEEFPTCSTIATTLLSSTSSTLRSAISVTKIMLSMILKCVLVSHSDADALAGRDFYTLQATLQVARSEEVHRSSGIIIWDILRQMFNWKNLVVKPVRWICFGGLKFGSEYIDQQLLRSLFSGSVNYSTREADHS